MSAVKEVKPKPELQKLTGLLSDSIKWKIDAAATKEAPAMAMTRLIVRLKCMNTSFRPWRASDIEWKNGAGFTEALRLFGTLNGLGGEGYQLSPTARRIEEEIVTALYLGERSRASHLLSEFSSRDRALEEESLIPIFEYCAKTRDPLFAMESWTLMMEKDIKLSSNCYFLTIRALCEGGYLKEAFSVVNIQRENSDMHPTLPVYYTLLKACVQMNSLSYASECLQMMEQYGVCKDLIIYRYLLRLAMLQQDITAVREIWTECVNHHSLNIKDLQEFIWAFSSLGDMASAYVALQQMVGVAFHCKSKKKNESNEEDIFGTETKEVVEEGLKLSEQPLSETDMKLLRYSFDNVIHACAKSRNPMLAEQVMLQMQDLGLELSSCTYDGFIKGLVSIKGIYDALEVLKIMEQKNLKPRDSTFAMLSINCSKGLELDLAEMFLDLISKCNHVIPFNHLLEACEALDQPERAVRVLAKLKCLNIMPDIRTYELLFSIFGNVNAPYEDGNLHSQANVAKRIKAIEMDMTRHGIQHSRVSMHNLLRALGREGMKNELIQYLHIAQSQFFNRNTDLGSQIYDTVLHLLVEAKEINMAIEIFKQMISCGLPPTAATYTTMIDCCSLINCYRSAFALVSMMIRNGCCLNVVTYTNLIKVLLKFEAFSEALRLLDQACSEGIRPDQLFYNAFLRAADEKGRIDIAELIIERMHQDKIQPDPSACSHVFSVYVARGFYSTALEALQVLSLRMISEEDDILQKFRLEYENLILDEGLNVETEIFEVFKDSPYLAVALLNLRWCAILSPVSWSPNQSPWAKRLSTDYALLKDS